MTASRWWRGSTRAFDEGRIGAADRDIRLGNVTIGAEHGRARPDDPRPRPARGRAAHRLRPHRRPRPYGAFDPKAASQLRRDDGERSDRNRLVLVIGVVVAVVLLVGAVVGGRRGTGSVASLDEGPSHLAGCAGQPGDPADPGQHAADDPRDPPAGPAYSLTAKGITNWLATYRQKFGTSLRLDLTFYERLRRSSTRPCPARPGSRAGSTATTHLDRLRRRPRDLPRRRDREHQPPRRPRPDAQHRPRPPYAERREAGPGLRDHPLHQERRRRAPASTSTWATSSRSPATSPPPSTGQVERAYPYAR